MTLNNEQDAIKQAVEAGGYLDHLKEYLTSGNSVPLKVSVFDAEEDGVAIATDFEKVHFNSKYEILTSSAFWQALGKARGWSNVDTIDCHCGHIVESHEYVPCFSSIEGHHAQCYHCPCKRFIEKFSLEWKAHALHYFEIKLSGGDTQTFWQTLP